jgi:hypothetical protein
MSQRERAKKHRIWIVVIISAVILSFVVGILATTTL